MRIFGRKISLFSSNSFSSAEKVPAIALNIKSGLKRTKRLQNQV